MQKLGNSNMLYHNKKNPVELKHCDMSSSYRVYYLMKLKPQKEGKYLILENTVIYTMIVSMFCNTCTCRISQSLQKINIITCVLLYSVDHDSHKFFAVFRVTFLMLRDHVVHWNASCQDIFSVWHDFSLLRDVHSQHVYL